MNIPKQLIEKYNVPVPRYTSYPPANFFKPDITHETAEKLYIESNKGVTKHMAFYIHIPFCQKICYYCGCNSCHLGNGNEVEPYVNALIKEIKMLAPLLDKSRPVTQLHYGGGTPNAIPAQYLRKINELLFDTFNFSENAEIAIETNPAYLDYAYIDELKEARFNRFSLGIQDFDTRVLKLVNREPSALPHGELLEYLRNKGNRATVNLDFIYGLPGQTVTSFLKTIEQAVALKPDRLVTFSYAHVPWMKKQQKILEKHGLPGPEEKFEMFMGAFDLLNNNGYETLGLDHYVLPDDELFKAYKKQKLHRNFQGYCTRETTGQVYALGVSGISQLDSGYIQYEKGIPEYLQSINSGRFAVEKGLVLNHEQSTIKEVITRLMCNKQLNWEEIAQHNAMSSDDLLKLLRFNPDDFEEFVNDGLLTISAGGLNVTASGSLFIRNMAAKLDPGFKPSENMFSKSV